MYKPYGKNLYYYNVNSLYPFIMKTYPMPCGTPVWNANMRGVDLSVTYGFIQTYIITPKNIEKPFIPIIDKNGTLLFPKGKFAGMYLSDELRYAQLGCGGVGLQLLQYIFSCRSLHAKQGLGLRVVGVCDSKSLILISDVFTKDFDDFLLLEICRLKNSSSSFATLSSFCECKVFTNLELTRKVLDIAALLGISTGLAFVDCTASSETIGVLCRVVELGCCVVLANKKPLTIDMDDYEKFVLHPHHI
ncbi:hypothetical protein GIB67_029415 [Kingdonia uniflora]|uniref:DNA-directed DNA polymerase n=1 Tax=Kingdonia uniflora TaxID=39325 RepID=A0A7J7NXU7_9MAGN|nr:hypothetical protein GIB67_029415 [Kingdonia uniflora]